MPEASKLGVVRCNSLCCVTEVGLLSKGTEVRMSPSPSGVQFRFAGPDDVTSIGEFLQELGEPHFKERRFPKSTAQDYYTWKYFGNSLGSAVVGLALASDRVVGTVAAMPKPLQVGARRVVAYQLGDALTAADFRKRGLFSQLTKMVCDEIALRDAVLVYGQPNEKSFPLLMNLGFVQPQQILQRHYPIPSRVLARRLHVSPHLISWTGIDKLMGSLAAPPASDPRVTVERISGFDRETDEIWQKVREDYTFLLERKHEYLNWRYVESPTPFQIWLARRDNKPLGFLVGFSAEEDRLGEIVDLFTTSRDSAPAQVLLNQAFREFHRQGMRAIFAFSISGSQRSAVGRLLRRACPLVRQKPLHFVVRYFDPTMPDHLDMSECHFSLGDFDGV